MPLKGNPSAAGKKPSTASNYSIPKGSDKFGVNERGQCATKPMNMSLKKFSRTSRTQEGKS